MSSQDDRQRNLQAAVSRGTYDEPLEDTIRLRGGGFPQAKTDSEGRFAIEPVPDGQYFVHVTPAANDSDHLPGGDQSRRSYPAAQLRGRSMTLTLSTQPSRKATSVGSSACLSCHQDQRHWNKTRAQNRMDRAAGSREDAGFLPAPEVFDALTAFVEGEDYRTGTHLEIGDYDARRSTDKFMLRGVGDARLPLEKPYADLFLWKKKQDSKYYMTLVNRLNPAIRTVPHISRSSCYMVGLSTISATSCRCRPGSATGRAGTRRSVTT